MPLLPQQKAEYSPARTILMHEPGEELFLGMMHPLAALFEHYFDADAAIAEHAHYRKTLADNGIEVVLVNEILLRGTMDKEGNMVEGPALDELRALASRCLTYDTSGLPSESAAEQQAYMRHVINSAKARDLARIVMLRPTIKLSKTGTNTDYSATYGQAPAMNLLYLRDHLITTAKGVVVGRMNSVQRQAECDIASFCLRKLGIEPLGRIDPGGEAFLEGGDFLPCGNVAFIGCGMRTTRAAIDLLMENDWLGCEELVVVNDSWHNQAQMHLDTYFNIIDKDLVTLTVSRLFAESSTKQHLTADIYMRTAQGYEKIKAGVSFVDLLRNDLGMNIIPVSIADGDSYANNFLTIGERRIMAIDGQSDAFKYALDAHDVEVTWLPMPNLTKGYGAAHCMTQVLFRG